jgi:hypothetical protein
MNKTIEQTKPEWFKGTWYSIGADVQNPFSGESYTLTGPELSMYDFIVGAQMLPMSDKIISDIQKGLAWFRDANPEAYMVLLD